MSNETSLLPLVLVFISSAYAIAFSQTNIKSEFVKLKTGDGITLHGMLWTPASGKTGTGIVIAPGGQTGRSAHPTTHQFRGREEEVLRITLEWLKKHKLSP